MIEKAYKSKYMVVCDNCGVVLHAEADRAVKLELCDGGVIWLPKSCIVEIREVEEEE